MSSNYARYDSPSTVADSTPVTQAEREELHRQLTAPGRVIMDSNGQVRIEQAQTAQAGTRRVGDVFTEGGTKFVIVADGDKMQVDAAKAAGLYPSEPVTPQANDKPGEQPENQQQEQPQSVTWSHADVDAVMETMGQHLPQSAMENLVALGVDGRSELDNYTAESIAQVVPGLDPATVKANYAKAVAAAQEAADALVEGQGVDADELYASMTVGERHDIADAFARGDAKPLVEAAKTWLARHGGQSQVDVERLLDPRNTVNGGSIYRDASTGKVMLKVDGLDEALTVQQAIERKFIKVSWA